MRHTKPSAAHRRDTGAVDTRVREGHARVTYRLKGFNTIHNPLVETVNGHRPAQTQLPIVFDSGLSLHDPDGVKVEALLDVCADHLNTKLKTAKASESTAMATMHIRKAVEELKKAQQAEESKR